ncbi:putative PDDEXK endonuclease [Acidithiobacillus caldus]
MAKMQREKGVRGERELFGLLSNELGTVVQRNLVQTRDSGADSLSIPGFAIEVKRQESPFRQAWWDQVNATRHQNGGVIPILFYRRSRHPWTAVFDLADIYPNVDAGSLCHTDLSTICQLIREELPNVRENEKAVA